MLLTLIPFLFPSCSSIQLHHNIVVWIALMISCICTLNVERDSISELWLLDLVLNLLLGEMLHIARQRPHGGKLRHLCHSWCVSLNWIKWNLPFDYHYIEIRNANNPTWHDVEHLFHVRSHGCIEKNITRCPFSWRISLWYLTNLRFQLSFTAM